MTLYPQPQRRRYSAPTLGSGSRNDVERNSGQSACFAPRQSKHGGPILPMEQPSWWRRIFKGQ